MQYPNVLSQIEYGTLLYALECVGQIDLKRPTHIAYPNHSTRSLTTAVVAHPSRDFQVPSTNHGLPMPTSLSNLIYTQSKEFSPTNPPDDLNRNPLSQKVEGARCIVWS